jgi:methionyl-tRNA formyltransferase
VNIGKFSYFIMGNSRIPIYCAEVLQRRGINPLGIISEDPVVLDWADQAAIPSLAYEGCTDSLEAFLTAQPFDYLLSIFNPFPLPGSILELPRKLALNYHNGPLPMYAGVNVTSWAILNKERSHGITWHVMTPKIDAGEIFVQRHFDLDPEETTFGANWKCFEAAVETFEIVADRLSSGNHSTTPQDLGKRTYFPRFKRPPACGLLDWSQSSEDISALTRALTFGNTLNTLALPKIWLGNRAIIVEGLRVGERSSTHLPGTIIDTSGSSITVATRDKDVVVSGAIDDSGNPVSLADLLASHNLRVGSSLPIVEPECRERLTDLNVKTARHEPFWIPRLTQACPLRPQDLHPSGFLNTSDCHDEFSTEIQWEGSHFLRQSDSCPDRVVLALYAIFLTCNCSLDHFEIGVLTDPAADELEDQVASALFSSFVPLRIVGDRGTPIGKALDTIIEHLDQIGARFSYLRDLPLRAAQSLDYKGKSMATNWPIGVILAGNMGPCLRPAVLSGSELVLIISSRSNDKLHISWKESGPSVNRELTRQIHDGFVQFLFAAMNNYDSTIGDIWAICSEFEEGEI